MNSTGEAGLTGWPARTPRSLYVHVPFCRHRCGYCNFTVVAGRDGLAGRFVDAVLAEADAWLARNERPADGLKTLFLGGGTPTQLPTAGFARLVEGIDRRFGIGAATEFSVECNPVDLDESRAHELAQLGVNRISLGVQSLAADKLRLLERDHSPSTVARAVEAARSFARTVSMDLIFGAPGESLEGWSNDLARALQLPVDHLSAYELTWEKGTSFWSRRQKGELAEADEDLRLAMYETTLELAAQAGLRRYEISSFARSIDHECLHNRVYWSGEPWLALGPGAASFESGVRRLRHRSTVHYLQQVEQGRFEWEADQLSVRERAVEVLCVGLRQVDGVNRAGFLATTGQDLERLAGEVLERLVREVLAAIGEEAVRLTDRGLLLHDGVAVRILSETANGN